MIGWAEFDMSGLIFAEKKLVFDFQKHIMTLTFELLTSKYIKLCITLATAYLLSVIEIGQIGCFMIFYNCDPE